MPSYSEIMGLAGFKSKNAAYKLVGKLVEQGVVAKDAQGRLIPKRLEAAIPVLGERQQPLISPLLGVRLHCYLPR